MVTADSWNATPGHYCEGKPEHQWAYALNNVTLAQCQTQCDAIGCTAFDYAQHLSGQPEPYVKQCRILAVGGLLVFRQNFALEEAIQFHTFAPVEALA
jgi:hypothetical protein